MLVSAFRTEFTVAVGGEGAADGAGGVAGWESGGAVGARGGFFGRGVGVVAVAF